MDEQDGIFKRLRYAVYRKAGLNQRKRRTVRRNLGYGTETFTRRVRILVGREQHVDIGGRDVLLPPDHRLGYYRERDAFYDVHAPQLLAALAAQVDEIALLDVGANIGDTALGALTAADNITVTSVEGHPTFVEYARRNLAAFGARAKIREVYVGPIRGDAMVYPPPSDDPDAGSAEGASLIEWVSPGTLLADLDPADLVIWKSDIDGFDIHVLVEHWDAIIDACAVIWFEYDPVSTLGDPTDTAVLVDRIATTGRGMIVFDNLGNRLLSVRPGDDIAGVLRDLTGWLYAQREGHVMVRYFDVWLVADELWPVVKTVGLHPNPAVHDTGA